MGYLRGISEHPRGKEEEKADLTPPKKMIGFILPNKGRSADLGPFTVTVDKVEEITGLDFFSSVPQPEQEELGQTITEESWDWIR